MVRTPKSGSELVGGLLTGGVNSLIFAWLAVSYSVTG